MAVVHRQLPASWHQNVETARSAARGGGGGSLLAGCTVPGVGSWAMQGGPWRGLSARDVCGGVRRCAAWLCAPRREEIAWTLQTLSANALELSRLWQVSGFDRVLLVDVTKADFTKQLPMQVRAGGRGRGRGSLG